MKLLTKCGKIEKENSIPFDNCINGRQGKVTWEGKTAHSKMMLDKDKSPKQTNIQNLPLL